MTRAIDLIAELSALRDREALEAMLAQALRELLPVRQASVLIAVGEEGDQRWLRRAVAAKGEPQPPADPAWVALAELPPLARQPHWLHCLRHQEVVHMAGAGPCRTLVPVLTDSGAAGVVELESGAPLGHDTLHTATSLLRVYRNLVGLLDYSERDTLTGLLNRKSFDETFLRATVLVASRLFGETPIGSEEGERRSGGAMPQWLGVLDIDHFKQVNDTHGHLIGDEVLLLVARLMRGTFRFGDRLYRFGGEEFVVLLAAPDAAGAAAAFERLRRNIAEYAFPRVGRVTVSVGFSDVRAGDTPQAAFERADRAVYYGKQNGRNQVRAFGDLVAQGVFTEDNASGDVELF